MVAARALYVSDAAVWVRAATSPTPSILITQTRDSASFDLGLALRHGHAIIEIGDVTTFAGRGRDETTLPKLAVDEASTALADGGFGQGGEAAELAALARRSLHALIRRAARSPLRQRSSWAQHGDAAITLGD